MSQKNSKTHGIQISSNHSTNIYGDLIGRDKINTTTVYKNNSIDLSHWQEMMLGKIEEEITSAKKKKELKKQIELIKASLKSRPKNLQKSEDLINTLAVMSEDIFDVAITTLVSPLAGIGLVLKKIGKKVKMEAKK